jgi:GTP 3',8-cyclase
LVEWAHRRGYDLTFIEVMPLGEISGERFDQYLPSTELRASLERGFTLTPSLYASGGLAQKDAADLRAPLRHSESDDLLEETVRAAISRKPKGHDFSIERLGANASTPRHMSVTGG